jgi:DUF1680 family protein
MREATRLTAPRGPVDTQASPHARWRTLALDDVRLDPATFWAQRQAPIRSRGLRHGFRMLQEWGNLDNLRLAAGTLDGAYRGPVFMDSDIYKWLEAVAYFAPLDADLQAVADEAIELVERAQASDGYLNSYYQVVEPTRRWIDIPMGHELYCAGHLIQAAVAWQRCCSDARLSRVVERLVDHILAVFGPDIRPGTPGHPEIETALVELYRLTHDPPYLRLAQFFVDQRGHGLLGPVPRWGGSAYYQDRVPVRDADEVEGHAVRALYLAAGVTDVYLETGEQALLQAVGRQWHDMVDRKLCITGGAGARHEGEAFGHPYELPNDRAYCETCAAIASIMWSWRMLLATGDGQYADLIERTLFNGFLSGISLDGERYFYVNPLLSDGLDEVIGRGGHERRPWNLVACCPPNVMRLLGSVGQYLATQDEAGIQVHQYFGGSVTTEDVELSLATDYPWSGSIVVTVLRTPAEPWRLSLRRPAWCTAAHVVCNGSDAPPPLVYGYLQVERSWQPGDRVELTLDMPVRLTRAHPRVEVCAGQVAIERGPIVYCFEQADHADADVLDIALDATAPLEARWQSDLLDGVSGVHAYGFVNAQPDALYMPSDGSISPRRTTPLRAVPYYAWSNRALGAMRVWTPIV